MPVQPLESTVRHTPGVAVIDLRGEIDGLSDEALDSAYATAEGANAQVIVLNFQQVDYINSTGIALIVGLLARARQGRRRLMVYGLSEHYQEIFTITRLSDFMTIVPDEASALAGAMRGT